MCALVRYLSPRYFPKRTSTQRFDEAPKLDGGLGSGTVPVIAIPLALGRAARVRHGSDKRCSRSKPDMDTHHRELFDSAKTETGRPPNFLDFEKRETHLYR